MRRTAIRGLLLALGLAGVLPDGASAELPAVRVTENASEDAEPAAFGRRLAWTGVDPDGADREVFWLDTALPRDAGPPLPCPQSNPCQVSENGVDDVRPWLSDHGVVWISRDAPALGGTLHFFDGAAHVAIPGTVASFSERWSVSGPLVLWYGRDADDRTGLFLFDVRSGVDAGTPAACPGSNPCAVALDPATGIDDFSDLHLSGWRAVWSGVPAGSGTDHEVHVFDATRAADPGPFAACPLGNPCLLTANDVADMKPVASASRIAWLRCPDDDCWSASPTGLVIASDTGTTEIPVDDVWSALQLAGPWLLFSGAFGDVRVFDTRQDVSLPWTECPGSNPCGLPGSAPYFAAGTRLLVGTGYDVIGPLSLRLIDLARPLDDPPYASCTEGTNPCVARDTAPIGDYAYSGPLIVWSQCDGEELGCYGDPTTEIYYAVPEPAAASWAAALLALAAVARSRARR